MIISEGNRYIDAAGRTILITDREKSRGGFWVYNGHQVDRNDFRIGQWRTWKGNGRDWAGAMSFALIRRADIGMKLPEAETIILERLIEAIETDIALPGKYGPKGFGSNMPRLGFDHIDVLILEFVDYAEGNGWNHEQRVADASEGDIRRAKTSAARVSRMEEALDWLRLVIADENRKMLVQYCGCKAQGNEWGEFLMKRNRKVDTKNAWIKRTTYRRISATLSIIAEKLRKDEIILRDGAGLHLAHNTAETPHNLIRSGCNGDREDKIRILPTITPAIDY